MKHRLFLLPLLLITANVVAISGCTSAEQGGGGSDDDHKGTTPAPTVVPEASIHAEISDQTLEIDDYDYGYIDVNNHGVIFSSVKASEGGIATIKDRGIVANKTPFNTIVSLNINFSAITKAVLYYGSSFLSFTDSVELSQTNTIGIPAEKQAHYFVIQSEGESIISSLDIGYMSEDVVPEDVLPVFNIETKNGAAVTSRTNYVECNTGVTDVNDSTNDLEPVAGQIKVRGESSSGCPKLSYRLKFTKKQSLFGLPKNKSWVLNADYMDGSKLHNNAAYDFARIVRKDGSFCVNQRHVQVILNGKDMGLYLFAEHINENEGRLDISQKKVWNKSFDEINFYVERSLYPDNDEKSRSWEVIPPETYYSNIKKIVFILKYPTAEDFEEELDSGEINKHETEYNAFYSALQNYFNDVCNAFFRYYESSGDPKKYNGNFDKFDLVDNLVDVRSLAKFGAIDQLFAETDHEQKSFKMYRVDGGKLRFGPSWDYDSCSDGLHFNNYSYEPYPYTSTERIVSPKTTWFNEKWSYILFKDKYHGAHLYKEIWETISENDIAEYIAAQYAEMAHLSAYYKTDTSITWYGRNNTPNGMHNNYRAVFDNLTYHFYWLTTQIKYLKDYYTRLSV